MIKGWTEIVGWERLNNTKFNVGDNTYVFANQAVYNKDLDEYTVTLFVITDVPKKENIIFKVILDMKGDKNHFGLTINNVIGLDENANEQHYNVISTTYPKISFTNKLKTPDKFILFIVDILKEKFKVATN